MASGANWVGAFLSAIAAEAGAAANTLSAYRHDLEDFSAHLGATTLAGASRADIEGYLSALTGNGLAPSTRARRLSSIRQFYRFVFQEGWRGDNPAGELRGPGASTLLPKTLSLVEVEALLAAARRYGRSAHERARNTCLFELLYATGMRVSELVALPEAAARGNPAMLLVRGKGGRERMVPLSPPAQAALAEWLVARDAQLAEKHQKSRALFPSRAKAGHFTRVGFFLLLKDVALAAGLNPEKLSPHTLRHAFATHLLANGADLRSIQMLLGHADVSTTEIYTHVLDETLKSLVLTKHPLA
ncbi:tyrosine recombinase [Abyssibius alkaniclasticus]|uniref:tyrosine recombinase n=1 Tax=Abyssibius alkaniclasticus TaxID=2881234 RepID=UPI0040594E2B